MSFLNNLEGAKYKLKPTETVVTQLDGKKYLEKIDKSKIEMPGKQYGFIVDTKPDNTPAKITEYIYLGSQDCCDLNIINNYNIKNVLSIGIEAPFKYENINYKFVYCLDLPEFKLDIILKDCVNFLNSCQENGKKVLVHCNAGVSRSASIVIGYLIMVHHYSYIDAYNIVKNARSCIQPNVGFIKQLIQLSNNK